MQDDAYHLDKSRIRASFERAAPSYDAAAVLQKAVRENLLARLDFIKLAPAGILDAGTGTGHGARALAARYPDSHVVALDIALGMLKLAASNQPWWRRLGKRQQSELCGDLENLPLATGSMGLIWSNLALQWCNDLDRALAEMARVLRPAGLFTFSTFGPDTLKELRESAKADPHHVHVSRFIDMHDIGDALLRSGFADPVLDVEHFVLTYDNVQAVMRDLKAIGAHNAAQGRRRGLQGKGFLRELAQRYERFRTEGKLPATFEVVYGHAWKATASPPALPHGAKVITLHPAR